MYLRTQSLVDLLSNFFGGFDSNFNITEFLKVLKWFLGPFYFYIIFLFLSLLFQFYN